MDEIPSAVKLPGEERGREGRKKRKIKKKVSLLRGNGTVGLNSPEQSTLVLKIATSKPRLG